MPHYLPGHEPEQLKKRIHTLFEKLDQAYPDKRIVGLHKDHKKWGETVTELYRKLGYPDGRSFLEAYGYKYIKNTDGNGRPVTTSHELIIKKIQERYSNTDKPTSIKQIMEDLPEYAGQIKTVNNKSQTLFGMSFKEYLNKIGVIEIPTKISDKQDKQDKQDGVGNTSVIICKVRPLGINKFVYYLANNKRIHLKDIVEIPFGMFEFSVYGAVEDVITCERSDAPCNIALCKAIIGKVDTKEYNSGIVRSILFANAADEVDKLINEKAINDFSCEGFYCSALNGNSIWAYCRGLSTEILKVLEYLRKKDRQVYDYKDMIMRGNGISELFVYTDDVVDVLTKYPNIKMSIFVEDKESGNVSLCYSRSGFTGITDSYNIGKNDKITDESWALKHSPVEDFEDGDILYIFNYSDDWNAVNYVFEYDEGSKWQLREER